MRHAVLAGGHGNDNLLGGDGDDILRGGLKAHLGVFSNFLDGGAGIDDCKWVGDTITNCE